MTEYFLDQVVPMRCTIRTVGIMEDDGFRFRILSVCSGDDCYFAAMIDGGANVGMAPNEDNLVDVRTISPVKVGLALSSDGEESESFCTCMGHLPMARTDDIIHCKPMLVNSFATDMILSPQHIVGSCQDFHSWTQVGFSGMQLGALIIWDAFNQPLLKLPLRRKNGLYYCDHSSLGLDVNPVHVRSFAAPPAVPDLWDDDDRNVQPTIQALRSLYIHDEVPVHILSCQEFQPCLPPLDEDCPFSPYMDPLDGHTLSLRPQPKMPLLRPLTARNPSRLRN